MTRNSDSHDAQRQQLRDYCQVSHCRRESDLTFKAIGLCDVHWKAACQDGIDIMDYLRENLVEAAILVIRWD